MDTERTPLVKKYGIPIAHLDFQYIKTCNDAREMEKIVHILRSNEEGYFPDLTKCAEDKLKELKPNSKQFRSEQNILTKETLNSSEWEEENEPIKQWSTEIKLKDNMLLKISESGENNLQDSLPPIRHEMKKINVNSKPVYNNDSKQSTKNDEKSDTKSIERIKSFEYDKWDKYDADTELLKMDLDEERIKEQVEIKNKENLRRQNQMNNKKIEIINEDKNIIDKLTSVERENLSIMHKDRGNDYYKSKEYDNAVLEYQKSLQYNETAAGYNNRAIAYLKLLKYNYCINDCDECLRIEPNNIKALLRKAQAFLGMDQRRNAYDVYLKIVTIDSSNKIAQDNIKELKKQLPDLPPVTATRLLIEEEYYKKEINTITEITVDSPLPSIKKSLKDSDATKTSINDLKQGPDSNIINKENQNTNEKTVENKKEKYEKQPAIEFKKSLESVSDEKVTKTVTENKINEKNTPKLIRTSKKPMHIEHDDSKIQKLKKANNEQKITTLITKNKKDESIDNYYGLEDLATLIIPKKLKKSKVALALEAMKNPKLNPMNKPNSNVMKNSNCMNKSNDSNQKNQLNFFPDNDSLRNLKFFQEMK